MAGDENVMELLDGPVLRTLRGCRERVLALSLGQRWRLARRFGLDVMDWDFENRLVREIFRPFRRLGAPGLSRRRAMDRVDLVADGETR